MPYDDFLINLNLISDQIKGIKHLKLFTTNYEPDTLIIGTDSDGMHYIKPLFLNAKRISGKLYKEIENMLTGAAEVSEYSNKTLYHAESKMGYDEFFDRYYNNLPGLST
jgi:hypothetical protein